MTDHPAGDGKAPRRDLDRRLFLFTTVLGAAAIVAAPTEAEAEPNVQLRLGQRRTTDNDPWDRVGRGRGATGTDRDPTDRVGRGRRRATDNDPFDRVGRGRGAPPRRATDSDPWDRPGRGRGVRNCRDSDPRDPIGRGRRC